MHVQADLEYAKRKHPATPTAPLKRMTGANPPLPTNEGETRSQYSIRPGLMAPTAAPVSQSEGRA
jgi:hypothetical protein